MKTRFLAGLLLVWLAATFTHAATVTGTLLDSTGSPVQTRITFDSISAPVSDPPNTIVRTRVVITNSANGTFSVVLQRGNYEVRLGSSSVANLENRFSIYVEAGSGTYDITDLVGTIGDLYNPRITIQEVDGSPIVSGVTNIIVSNGTLMSNGVHSVMITTGGGGGGTPDDGSVTDAKVATNAAIAASKLDLSGVFFTNSAPNDWHIFRDASLYHALHRDQRTMVSSNNVAGLLRYVIDANPTGARSLSVTFAPDYRDGSTRYPYTFDSTVIVTNAVIIQGAGNSATTFAMDADLNAPILSLGALGTKYNGIFRFNNIRFEGTSGGANGVGVKVVSAVEPNFEHTEFFGFKRAGIELANTNAMMWAQVDHCWFVVDNGGAGILISETPLEANAYMQGEFRVAHSLFGVGSGQGIKATVPIKNLSIKDSRFWWYGPFSTSVQGISLVQPANSQIVGNHFQDWPTNTIPVRIEDTGSATNLNLLVAHNTASRGAGAVSTPHVVYVGDNNQGVTLIGNRSPDGAGYLLGTGTGLDLVVDATEGIATRGLVDLRPGAGFRMTATNSYNFELVEDGPGQFTLREPDGNGNLLRINDGLVEFFGNVKFQHQRVYMERDGSFPGGFYFESNDDFLVELNAPADAGSDYVVTLPSVAGTLLTITGDGSGLTSLNGSQVTSGTIDQARLDANVVMDNEANTLTGATTFSGPIIIPATAITTALDWSKGANSLTVTDDVTFTVGSPATGQRLLLTLAENGGSPPHDIKFSADVFDVSNQATIAAATGFTLADDEYLELGLYYDGTRLNVSGLPETDSGSGLPNGGTTGQVLAKASNDDGDAEWVTPDSPTWTTGTLLTTDETPTTVLTNLVGDGAVQWWTAEIIGNGPTNSLLSTADIHIRNIGGTGSAETNQLRTVLRGSDGLQAYWTRSGTGAVLNVRGAPGENVAWKWRAQNVLSHTNGLAEAAAPVAYDGADGPAAYTISTGNSTIVVPVANNVTAGKHAVLIWNHRNTSLSVSGITDSSGNTWTVHETRTGTTANLTLASAPVTTQLNGGSSTVTITLSGTVGSDTGTFGQLFRLSNVTGVDVDTSASANSTTPVASASTTVAPTVIIGAVQHGNSQTYGSSSWTAIGSVHEAHAQRHYYLRHDVAGTGSQTMGGTISGAITWATIWAAFY
jgi:hypothetical protein